MESANGITFFPVRRWRGSTNEFIYKSSVWVASYTKFNDYRQRFGGFDCWQFSDSQDVFRFLTTRWIHPFHRWSVECLREPNHKGPPLWEVKRILLSRKQSSDQGLPQLMVLKGFDLLSSPGHRLANFYFCDSVDLAMYLAYHLNQQDGFYRDLRSPPMDFLQYSDMIYRDLDRKYEVDADYCKLIGVDVPNIQFEPDLGPACHLGHFEVVGEVNEVLLDKFVHKILENIERADVVDNSKLKFSGLAIGDIVSEPGLIRFSTTKRKDIDFNEIFDIVNRVGAIPAVGCLGKCSTLTSDGKIRSIFPMHLGYECLLRYKFRNSVYDKNHIYIKQPYHFRVSPGVKLYENDIRKCDKQMMPYLIAAASAMGAYWLVPFIRYKGVNYTPTQMCSGIYGTDLLTNWFVSAALDCIPGIENIEHYIQGDGVLLPADVEIPFLEVKRNPVPNQLNGFQFYPHKPAEFLNAKKILLPRGKRAVPPEHRYAILYASYKYLNAPDIECYYRPDIDVSWEGVPYNDWDNIILGHFCNHHKYPYEINIYDGSEGSIERSTWDCTVVTGAKETIAPKMLRREKFD